MKLSLFVSSISAIACIATSVMADDFFVSRFHLAKRDHGLPYSTLPSNTCSTPSTCSNIPGNVTCRCSNDITVCVNTENQYCWGSITLNITSCPPAPSTCNFPSDDTTQTSLCNNNNVLYVDQSNNYCYGSVNGTDVTVQALPYAVSASALSASSTAASASVSATGTTVPSMGVSGSPQSASTALPSSTSGTNKLSIQSFMTIGYALAAVAYVAAC